MINVKYEVKLYCPKSLIGTIIPNEEIKEIIAKYDPETYDFSGRIDEYITAQFDDMRVAEEFEYRLLQLFDNYMSWEDNEVYNNTFRSMP